MKKGYIVKDCDLSQWLGINNEFDFPTNELFEFKIFDTKLAAKKAISTIKWKGVYLIEEVYIKD